MITATQGSNATPIVRVPWNEAWLIKPVLDAGAMGVIVPMIRSRDDAAAAVRAVRYPPSGERGFGPFYASMRFNTAMIEYPDPADREIQLVLLIEHKDAIDDIERIVELDGIDVCFIAPFDLAMSYGYRDGVDYPEVKDGVARAEKAILASGIHLGGLALDTDAANAMIERGYRLILTGFDTMLIARSAAAIIDGIKRPSSTETQ
jgi:4-hydroxy-2-oxoheptanedioate aldolase